MKILYAASNNSNARLQLARFLRAMQDIPHQIKISAYQVSSPKNINIDWSLDCLLNIFQPDTLYLDNDNLSIYFEQVKSFAPDLIISDLEYFTSYIANTLNIPLWQYSSSLIQQALTWREKYHTGLHKYFVHSLRYDTLQRTINLIDNSSRNFVCSHYGDTVEPPIIQSQFEWIRPYHQVAKEYIPCQHYIVAGLSKNNKRVLNVLKKYPDSVAFMETCAERHQNVLIKDISMEDEYYCNLKNSPLFICQGQASLLADAFYNGKFPIIYPDYHDTESIINSHISQKLGLGYIMTFLEDISDIPTTDILPTYRGSVKYLHEQLKGAI